MSRDMHLHPSTSDLSSSLDIRRKLFEVQPLITTNPILEPDLYVRATSFWEPIDRGADGLFLPAGCTLDFDTFINAFFEWHWVKWTTIGATALVLEIEGTAAVRVYRTHQSGRRINIAYQDSCTGHCTIDLPSPCEKPGRLSFELAAIADGAVLKNGHWATSHPSENDVQLDVVICTFNKQDFLDRALSRLARYGLGIGGLRNVIVVDQGTKPFATGADTHLSVLDAIKNGRIRFLKQKNLGGSGGFTRGIIESLDDNLGKSPCSHIMLMDDDVQFEPRLIYKLVPFLGRCRHDTVVGGSMLDMFRPEHLFAYSETFDTQTAHVRREVPHDLDLRDPSSLGLLEGAPTGNYNGWFVCCFPRSAFEAHGLPLPFFIRSDDCEFGTRLTRAGVPLAHMPGLFVWHEPFWNKPRAWIDYYSYRNHLIVAALAAPKKPPCLAIKQLVEFWYFITTYQYDSALAVCIAVEHYCKGPDWVFTYDETRHASIFEAFALARRSANPNNLLRDERCPARSGKPRSRLHPLIPVWVAFFLNIYWNTFGRVDERELRGPALQAVEMNKMWFYPFHGFAVVLQDSPDENGTIVLRHDPKLARVLTIRMLQATARFLRNCTTLGQGYRNAVGRYSSRRSWNSILGISQEPDTLNRVAE